MIKKPWLIVVLLVGLVFLVGGCSEFESEPVTVPGKSHFDDARLRFADSVEVKAGETKSIDVTLETQADGPGEFSYSVFRVGWEYGEVELPLPDGLAISLDPSSFMAYPDSIYHSSIIIETTSALSPGEYWLHLAAVFEGEFHLNGPIKLLVET
jgi:hypothetical protein